MYEAISSYYDLFMRDDDSEWIEFAVNATKGKKSGVDVGCGSGKVTEALAVEHDVVGVDSSPEMLREAEKRLRGSGKKVTLVLGNGESVKLHKKVDFVTAMCDVVNYMRRPIDFFQNAFGMLEDGGLLVFDVSSPNKLRTVLGNNVFTDSTDEVTYIWENSLSKNKVDIHLTFFCKDGEKYVKREEYQTQYIHEESDLVCALQKVGFKVKTHGRKDRIYFTAEKL